MTVRGPSSGVGGSKWSKYWATRSSVSTKSSEWLPRRARMRASDRLAVRRTVDRLGNDAGGFQQPAVVGPHLPGPEGEVENDIPACSDEIQQLRPEVGLDLVAYLCRQRHGADASAPHLHVEGQPDHAAALQPLGAGRLPRPGGTTHEDHTAHGRTLRRARFGGRGPRATGSAAGLGSLSRVSELPISSKYRSTPDAPVTSEDREQLSRRLNDAFTAGRLDQDDYSQRLDRLFAAQRLGELVPVVDGLPAVATYSDPAAVQQPSDRPPGELTEARSGNRLTIAVIGGVLVLVIVLAVVLAAVL